MSKLLRFPFVPSSVWTPSEFYMHLYAFRELTIRLRKQEWHVP